MKTSHSVDLAIPKLRQLLFRAFRRYLEQLPGSKFQRDVLIERLIAEALDFLADYKSRAHGFVPGSSWPGIDRSLFEAEVHCDVKELLIGGHQVMQAWQDQLMKRMAELVTAAHGDVLEIGFGLGIASQHIQRSGVRSHTIIEAHPAVLERLDDWRRRQARSDIVVLRGRWEEIIDNLESYDAIFFDPYPMTQAEFVRHWREGATYAAHFFPVAARHLRPAGVLTYFSNEIDTMSRRHQRALLEHFESIQISVVKNLKPPPDCQYWWTDSMVVVKATTKG